MGNGRRFSVLHNKTAGCVRKASTQLPQVSKKPIPFGVIVDHHPSLGYSAHAAGKKRQTGVISQYALKSIAILTQQLPFLQMGAAQMVG